MKCKICGTRINEGEKFCPKCGTEVGTTDVKVENLDESVEKKYCPDCGSLVLGEHRFCVKCGANLQNVKAVAEIQNEVKEEISSEAEKKVKVEMTEEGIRNLNQVGVTVCTLNSEEKKEIDVNQQIEKMSKKKKTKSLVPVCLCIAILLGFVAWQIFAYRSLMKIRNIYTDTSIDIEEFVKGYKFASTSLLKNEKDEAMYAFSVYFTGNKYFSEPNMPKALYFYEYAIKNNFDKKYYSSDYKGVIYTNLGLMYTFDEKEFDNKKALEFLEKGVAVGNSDSKYILGYVYYHGNKKDKNGVEISQNFDKAFPLIKDVCEIQNNGTAQCMLAGMYSCGWGCKQDYIAAQKYYELAAQNGDDVAKKTLKEIDFDFHIGEQLYKEKKYDKAIEHLERTANPKALNILYDAKYELALDMYNRNEIKSKSSISRFLNLITVPAENGHEKSQILLGHYFSYKDWGKCSYYYKKASDQGSVEGKYGLAWLYHTTGYPGYNVDKAIKLYEIPVKENYTPALFNLGFIYYNNSRYLNLNKAAELFSKAAINNDDIYSVSAKYYLANMLCNGDGMSKDMVRAKQLYKEVAEANIYLSSDAREKLNRMK